MNPPTQSTRIWKGSHFAQFLCNVSPFKINTSKCVSKQATLSTFRINTYEKQAGWGRAALPKPPFHSSASRNELVCFQALAHSFLRRRSVNSFHCNNFRTLSIATEGVPSLHSNFAQLWPNLSLFRINTYGPPRKCCKQKTYAMTKPFRCNTYKKTGGRPFPVLATQLRVTTLSPPLFHGSRNTGHKALVTGFVLPYLVTSLLPYLPARLTCLLLHCSTHGSPTPRPTLPRRSPLARRDRARHSRLPALHCAARRRRAFLASPDSSGSALLDRNWFGAR